MRKMLVLTVLFLTLCVPALARSWDPAHTWVFAVGVLEWEDSERYHPFPKAHRRDEMFVRQLQRMGVSSKKIVFLKDQAATKEAISGQFAELCEKAEPDDLLIVYYAGHGTRNKKNVTCLVPYDASADDIKSCWSATAIFKSIEAHFKGSHVLLLSDCCYSGGLAREAQQHRSNHFAYAVLTSSQASSASTGAWTYTEALLDGFSGNPLVDRNHDGKITLAELGHYAEEEMAFGDQQLSTFQITGAFDSDLVLSDVKGGKPPQRVGERLEVEQDGKWWRGKVIGQRKGEYRVHYYGWDQNWDEWVKPERMRPPQEKVYEVGARVQVEWQKKWYPATVMKVYKGVHYIHYDGEDAVWDEWVGTRRMRDRT